jgi:hypothetical protein
MIDERSNPGVTQPGERVRVGGMEEKVAIERRRMAPGTEISEHNGKFARKDWRNGLIVG